jgi:hypothetical protein
VTGGAAGDAEVIAVIMVATAAMLAPSIWSSTPRRWSGRMSVPEYIGGNTVIYKRKRRGGW